MVSPHDEFYLMTLHGDPDMIMISGDLHTPAAVEDEWLHLIIQS